LEEHEMKKSERCSQFITRRYGDVRRNLVSNEKRNPELEKKERKNILNINVTIETQDNGD
jgi:hypothetical protein